ncbi:hypothetical protein TNCT_323081 [Trichonephila clavata]|uniref:Uncharacterized protein n=1 Tax=Trichonephila clavata TaxID=2740835 RepID=A0A8X6KYN6_TRICU|nr:hypothetical protein TNCT_323081 [Trichonephila clavata]
MWWYSAVGLQSSPVLVKTQGCSGKRSQSPCSTTEEERKLPSLPKSVDFDCGDPMHSSSCRRISMNGTVFAGGK